MVESVPAELPATGPVRRRRVIYVPGYDPFHARRYRELYRREAEAQAGKEKKKPVSPAWFLSTISKILPPDSIIFEEAVTHRLLIHRYLGRPGACFAVHNGLGIGLGVAAGAKLAYPDKTLVFLVGDGTFNFNPVLAGLGFCQEYQVPFLTIVLGRHARDVLYRP